MRLSLTVLAAPVLLVALAGCDPTMPDSAAGVGFGDYNSYMRERAAQPAQRSIVPAPQVTTLAPRAPDAGAAPTQVAGAPLSAIPQLDPGSEAQVIARDAVAALRPADQPASGPMTAPLQSGAPITAAGVSDQSDLEALRAGSAAVGNAQYREIEVVQPTALPERDGDTPNVIAYALRSTNRVGESIYRRSILTTQNHQRNCAQFASQDLAQEEFLRRGGPQRDPLNLDPDGDGFACWWDPSPYRAAARAAN